MNGNGAASKHEHDLPEINFYIGNRTHGELNFWIRMKFLWTSGEALVLESGGRVSRCLCVQLRAPIFQRFCVPLALDAAIERRRR